MERVGEAEHVIESLGCGRFQAVSVLMLYNLCSVPTFFTALFMVYGNYNPGWACLDITNNTEHAMSSPNRNHAVTIAYSSMNSSHTNHSVPSRPSYTIGSCATYESCQVVEFNPEASTLVTEWKLLCNRSWGLSVIICVHMAGMLFGAYVAGQCLDSFGRKKTLYTQLFLCALIHLILSFSVGWEMFATLQFFAGWLNTGIMNCYYVYLQEFLTKKWRGPTFGIPAFNIGGILFALFCMWLKDWRHIQRVATGAYILAFLPVFWIPESLRWLGVKDRKRSFAKVADKIARINGKRPLPLDDLNFIVAREEEKEDKKIKNHTIFDLFHKGYKMYAVIIGVQWFSVTCIFFAIYFGIKSLYGNFYINMLLMDLIEIPFCVFRMAAPNLLGRKKATILYFFVCTICLYIITVLYVYTSGTFKTVGIVICALMAKINIHAAFDLIYTYTPEIYPTVVRGLSVGWGSALARFGGFASAFLIPSDPDTYFINYAVMGSMGLICCVVTLGLPETRGKPLKETFDDGDMDARDIVVVVADTEKQINESL